MNKADPHPNDEQLLLYADGTLARPEAAALEIHISTCDDCYAAVIQHRQLSDLEALGLLPPAHSLRRPWDSAIGKRAGGPGKPGVLGMIGGLMAGLGVTGLAHSPHGALAHGRPAGSDSSSDEVRNVGADSSHESQHEHSEDASVNLDSDTHFHSADTHYGQPSSDAVSPYVQQGYSDTCAVQCQRLILNDFGVAVTEDQLVHEAQAGHLYAPGHGTQLEDVGKLLEAHGLHVNRVHDANVFNLATELAQGHKVIVGLDSGELWHQNSVLESIADRLGIGSADHAVIVSGIDTSDPNHVKVIITDPGTGDVAKQYPLGEFLNAWHTSHFTMVSTVDPVPSWHHEMVNFDYDAGHISHVGAVPYDLAHQLEVANAHESDPAVHERLSSLFVAAASGHVSLAPWLGGHSGSLSGGVQHLLSAMMTLAHEGLSGPALVHSFANLMPETASHGSSAGHMHDSHDPLDLSSASQPHWQEPDHHSESHPYVDPSDLHHENPDSSTHSDTDPDSSLDDPSDPSGTHHDDWT